MLQIGITGGIGTGKSIVSRVFGLLGIPVYDSDAAAKRLMATDLALRQELQQAFGEASFSAAGELDRVYLAKAVFNNPEQLARLNALVHPHVGRDYKAWVEAQALQGVPYVLKEAALLFEANIAQSLDRVITVFAPLELRLSRLTRRDTHRTEADILHIIARQLPAEEHLQRAHHIIYNDDRQLVIPQVVKLHGEFISKIEDRRLKRLWLLSLCLSP